MKKTTSILRTSFVLILAVTLLFFSVEHVKAEDSPVAMEKKIEFLKSIGTTDEALSFYSDQQINGLYDRLFGQDVSFSGFTSQEVEVKEKINGERGNIPTSKLQLSVGTYDLKSNDQVTGLDVTLGYKWVKEPILHLDDALTFSWDKDMFYDDGFYAMANCTTITGLPWVLENINAPAKVSDGGLGWYTSIAEPRFEPAQSHYGGAQVLLRPRNPFSTSAVLHSKMRLEYAHQILGASIVLGVNNSGANAGVTFSAGKYDYQSVSHTYR